MAVIHYDHDQKGAYSLAVQDDMRLYISGLEASVDCLEIGDEFKSLFDQLEVLLKRAQFELHHVVKVTLYYKVGIDLKALNRMYSILFMDPYPTRSLLGVQEIPDGKNISVEILAVKHEKKLHKERFVCEGC